jgi:hypothetical protein
MRLLPQMLMLEAFSSFAITATELRTTDRRGRHQFGVAWRRCFILVLILILILIDEQSGGDEEEASAALLLDAVILHEDHEGRRGVAGTERHDEHNLEDVRTTPFGQPHQHAHASVERDTGRAKTMESSPKSHAYSGPTHTDHLNATAVSVVSVISVGLL